MEMVSSSIDHMVAVTVFLAATLLFIGLFSQTIQTAVVYQAHNTLATKASDLLDNILLNPGSPVDWSLSTESPREFGLQDPEFTQYKLSSFSLMRLNSFAGNPVYYYKAGSYYSNVTVGSGSYLLMPFSSVVNYSKASSLLGINTTYGFQLSVTPVVSVSMAETQASNPLRLSVNVEGIGMPLANAQVSYYFVLVSLSGGDEAYPSYTARSGTVSTDEQGYASLNFPDVTDATMSYSMVAYARLSGVNGVGCHQRLSSPQPYVIPFVGNLTSREIFIAHSYDVQNGPAIESIMYNSTFVVVTEDSTLREVPLENAFGTVNYGEGNPYGVVTLPSHTPGILITTYRKGSEGGIILMPWGLGSLAFPMVFGGNPAGQEWVSTDTRQVLINSVAYQAKLALWSLEGHQVNG
jgi:hypothetical protein